MTTIFHEDDGDLGALDGQRIAVVGYGNQGRCWALNLRDSGLDVSVHGRREDTQDVARADGFEAFDIPTAGTADVLCILVPDDVIPMIDVTPGPDALVIIASGYAFAFDRWVPDCDRAMIAPRMLGPEVRETYLEGIGFMSGIGIEHDKTGTAKARTLAVARGLGALGQGGIEMSARQEAVLDLGVEQLLAPALRATNLAFTQVMAENGIPMEGILAELFLSGEVERTFKRLRLEGYAAQLNHHSPASQYGQLSRGTEFPTEPTVQIMRRLTDHIASGGFADEWDDERDHGYPKLEALRAEMVGDAVVEWERDLRTQLGETAARNRG